MTVATLSRDQFREVTRQPDGQPPVRSKGVYRVTLLREGPGNPRDRHYYTGQSIAKSPHLFEGLPCFADHPDAIEEEARPERSVRDMVGWFEKVDAAPDKTTGKMLLQGDLVTIPGPSTNWVRELLDATLLKKTRTPNATELVGLSINATGTTEDLDVGGETWHAVQEFMEAKSCDLVTQAGAGGRVEALKEAMAESIREGMMSALQVKKAASQLRALDDPSLQPVIDVLDKVHVDLTHEPPERGKTAMGKEAALSTVKRPPGRVVVGGKTARALHPHLETEDGEDEDERLRSMEQDEDEDEAARRRRAKAAEQDEQGDEQEQDEALEARIRQTVARELRAARAAKQDEDDGEDEAAEASLRRWSRAAEQDEDEQERKASEQMDIGSGPRPKGYRGKAAEVGGIGPSRQWAGQDQGSVARDDEKAPASKQPKGFGKPANKLPPRGKGIPGDIDTYRGDVEQKGGEYTDLNEQEDEDEEEAREDQLRFSRVRVPKVKLRHGVGPRAESEREAEELPAAFAPRRKKATESLRIPSTLREAVALQVYRHTKARQPSRGELLVENAKLRAQVAVSDDQSEARSILRESGLPLGTWPWLMRQIFGQPPEEKRRIVDAFREAQLAMVAVTRDEEGPGPGHGLADGETVDDNTDRLAQFDVPLTGQGRA